CATLAALALLFFDLTRFCSTLKPMAKPASPPTASATMAATIIIPSGRGSTSSSPSGGSDRVSGDVVGSMNLLHQWGELQQSGRDRTATAYRGPNLAPSSRSADCTDPRDHR